MENIDIKNIINEINEENKAIIENKFEIILIKLDQIKEQTLKNDTRINKVEETIQDFKIKENNHILNCPQIKKIEELKTEIDRQKSVKSFLNKALITAGALLALVFSVDKLVNLFK